MLGLPRATWSAAAEGEVMMEEVEARKHVVRSLLEVVEFPHFGILFNAVVQSMVTHVITNPVALDHLFDE
jgi:hypothetical protein